MRIILFAAALFAVAALGARADEAWQAEWAKTLAAARSEGSVVVSGPPGPIQRQVITDQWAKAFPAIKLEYTGARGTQILSKVVRERAAGVYNWDIVLASGDPTIYMLPPINALAPVRDALIDPALSSDKTWIGGFQEGFLDSAGKYFYSPIGVAGSSLGFINRNCVSKDELATSDDLKKPWLKGKIAWYDPLVPGSSSRSLWQLSEAKGEAWMKDLLLHQDITYTRDYRQIVEWLVSCHKPVTAGVTNDQVLDLERQGVAKNLEEMTGPAYFGGQPPGWGGANEDIGWYNQAPHPNAAKLFVNWYLSHDFQQAYATAMQTNSRRLDVKPEDPDPNHLMHPGVRYRSFSNQAAIDGIRALQKKLVAWGVEQ